LNIIKSNYTTLDYQSNYAKTTKNQVSLTRPCT